MMHKLRMTNIDTLLSALSHPARRGALRLLSGGEEHCLCELMDKLGVSQSSMSRHMAALKDAGLITDRRDAQWMRYRLRMVESPELQAVVSAVLSVDETGPDRAGGGVCCKRNAA
jgi:ArsR family transcriptional regulator